MSKRSEYIDQYAEAAKEQMKRYGIPASVILAQGIIESGNGQSELTRLGNNHFGVKATKSWLDNGGEFLVYTDDKPNEKFCKYESVADSYEHHSRFLVENRRYSNLFNLSPDDYQGWADGLQQAGYATGSHYSEKLKGIIEANGLDRFDQEVMQEMQGKDFGVSQNPRQQSEPAQIALYAFPLESKEFLLVTSPFGMRTDPMDHSKQQMHKGIDLWADHAKLFATEDGGKVVDVNNNPQTAGGLSVTVEYDRENGSKVRLFFCHLESVDVKVGDTVQAGQQLGISGNTGTRTTGAHLHFGVKQVSSDGTSRDVDPVSYLADIAVKGNIQQQVMCNGENLLNRYTTPEQRVEQLGQDAEPSPEMSPMDWMKKLLSSEDAAGQGMSADPIMDMIISIFGSLMALALQIDNKSHEEQMQHVTESALDRRIDLTGLVPGVKDCVITWTKDAKPQMSFTVGDQSMTHTLTDMEVRNLSSVLQDASRSDAEKQQRLVSLVHQITLQQQVSNNYDQQVGQGESLGLQR